MKNLQSYISLYFSTRQENSTGYCNLSNPQTKQNRSVVNTDKRSQLQKSFHMKSFSPKQSFCSFIIAFPGFFFPSVFIHVNCLFHVARALLLQISDSAAFHTVVFKYSIQFRQYMYIISVGTITLAMNVLITQKNYCYTPSLHPHSQHLGDTPPHPHPQKLVVNCCATN